MDKNSTLHFLEEIIIGNMSLAGMLSKKDILTTGKELEIKPQHGKYPI